MSLLPESVLLWFLSFNQTHVAELYRPKFHKPKAVVVAIKTDLLYQATENRGKCDQPMKMVEFLYFFAFETQSGNKEQQKFIQLSLVIILC